MISFFVYVLHKLGSTLAGSVPDRLRACMEEKQQLIYNEFVRGKNKTDSWFILDGLRRADCPPKVVFLIDCPPKVGFLLMETQQQQNKTEGLEV